MVAELRVKKFTRKQADALEYLLKKKYVFLSPTDNRKS
jgi:hypothetical protein